MTPSKVKSSDGKETEKTRILIADDEPVTRRMFSRYLENAGFEVIVATDGLDALRQMDPDVMVAVLDLNMPGMGGLECLKKMRGEFADTEVLIISGAGQIQDAVAALKAGACEFVTKPCEQDDLVAHVQQAIRTAKLSRENQRLRSAIDQPSPTSRFSAKSAVSRELVNKISKLAGLDSTILLTGESGTGKTTIARMIHDQGPRSSKPFIAVNCASLPRDLIEAELFGHVKGAFTGAAESRPGRAEIADGGTLFLDEIGDLPLDLQPKLLTFLQDRTLQRIGSNKEIKVDVRLIAATLQDLGEMCSQRRFRPDLYYRLNVLHLEVPALRDRRGDIPDLASTILERIARQRRCGEIRLNPEAARVLQQHDWPGNIREMENVLERASAFCEGEEILESDLSLEPSVGSTPPKEKVATTTSYVGLTLKEIEKRALLETLEAHNGNKAMAARQLGISEKSIYNKLRRFGLFEKQES
jgi:DNA-binding NtrC family response regulator